MEKLKLHTPDQTAANVEKIAQLFPGCVVEARDEQGNLTRSIDFDQLRQELSGQIVEGPRERYHLDWPGKREALLAANAPIAKSLRPCRGESVDFDTTKNLFIEGDNLDALKLLQETYLSKVKMIYIDPPYNTGNDFIYEDDFSEEANAYSLASNQIDAAGNRLIANKESNGRFHSDWLSMLYPRLKVSWQMLRDDGVIFASIAGNELSNLTKLFDEIFGANNRVGELIWRKKEGGGMADQYFATEHEYIIVYSKSANFEWKDEIVEAQITDFPKRDGEGKAYKLVKLAKWGNTARREDRPTMYFKIAAPDGKEVYPIAPDGTEGRWRVGKDTVNKLLADDLIEFVMRDGVTIPYERVYFDEKVGKVKKVRSILYNIGGTADGTNELTELFGKKDIFENPKPHNLIKLLAQYSTKGNDIVIDFFAGSCTTAQAIMQLNAEDEGQRRFINVQLPEVCAEKSEAYRSDYKTIAEIGKERMRRAGRKIRRENEITSSNLDIGFRVLKIDTSNMRDIYYAPDAVKQNDLVAHTDNIKEDRTPEDLLFQVLVDWGVDLALPIETQKISGKTVFFVDGNALAACFEPDISEALVKELAKRKPLRAVFRDNSFASDSVKVNVEQIFKLLSPSTEVKSL